MGLKDDYSDLQDIPYKWVWSITTTCVDVIAGNITQVYLVGTTSYSDPKKGLKKFIEDHLFRYDMPSMSSPGVYMTQLGLLNSRGESCSFGAKAHTLSDVFLRLTTQLEI